MTDNERSQPPVRDENQDKTRGKGQVASEEMGTHLGDSQSDVGGVPRGGYDPTSDDASQMPPGSERPVV
jgi:hypothetical protein